MTDNKVLVEFGIGGVKHRVVQIGEYKPGHTANVVYERRELDSLGDDIWVKFTGIEDTAIAALYYQMTDLLDGTHAIGYMECARDLKKAGKLVVDEHTEMNDWIGGND